MVAPVVIQLRLCNAETLQMFPIGTKSQLDAFIKLEGGCVASLLLPWNIGTAIGLAGNASTSKEEGQANPSYSESAK